MRFVLKLDKNDEYKTADIRDLTAVELLILNKCLRKHVLNDDDRVVRDRMVEAIDEGSEHPTRPLKAIDGAELPVNHCTTAEDDVEDINVLYKPDCPWR